MNKKDEILALTKLKVKVFTHNDLDGVSCAIILKKLYGKEISFNFSFISYNQYDEIKKFLDFFNGEARLYDYIFITDLNFTTIDYENFIEEPLNEFFMNYNSPQNSKTNNIFKKIFLIDHHVDSEKTLRNKAIKIFNEIEYYNDLNHCASWQLADWCIHKKSSEWTSSTLGLENKNYYINSKWVMDYIKYVNDWDLFHWKDNKNYLARDLNLLFTHIKREKYFMMQEQKDSPVFSFNKTEKTIIKETLESIHKEYERAIRSSVVLDHVNQHGIKDPNLQYIVIRSDENISLICDIIKDEIKAKHIYKMFNIGYIVNVSFKYGSLNFRRIDENIDLSVIANWYGGGGHPFASGCILNSEDKNLMNNFVLPILSKYRK